MLFVGPGLSDTVEVAEQWRLLAPTRFAPGILDRKR